MGVKLRNICQLQTFFKTKQNKLQKGVLFMEETKNKKLQEQELKKQPQPEQTKQILQEKIKQAKESLNIKKVIELSGQLAQFENNTTQNTKDEPEQVDEVPPTTLSEARKRLEFALLKEFLNTKETEQVSHFLQSQVNLDADIKQQLEGLFLTKRT
jgi:hypothetical protein